MYKRFTLHAIQAEMRDLNAKLVIGLSVAGFLCGHIVHIEVDQN